MHKSSPKSGGRDFLGEELPTGAAWIGHAPFRATCPQQIRTRPGTPSEREAALAAATLATLDGVEPPKEFEVSAYVVYNRIKSGDWYGKGDYVKNRPFAPLKEAKVKCDLSNRCVELVRQLLEKRNIIATRKGVTSRRVTDLLDSPVANMAPLTPAAGEL